MAIREGEGVGRRHPNVTRREHGVIWEWQQIRTPKVAISAIQAPPLKLTMLKQASGEQQHPIQLVQA